MMVSLVVLDGVTVTVVVFVTSNVVLAARPATLLVIVTTVCGFTGTVGTTTETPACTSSTLRPEATRTPPIVMLILPTVPK